LGVILGLARLARRPWIHYPAAIYIELIRGIPLVMVIFWFWFLVPVFLGRPVPEYWIALAAFVMFEGAYIGEIVRAGIQSVPRGQIDAATATGLTYFRTMSDIILPQAIRNMIPSLVTQFIVLFKDTSLASIIGMMDLTKAAQTVTARELRPFEMYIFIAVVYWMFTYSMSRYARWLEIRMSHERAAT
jgi:His/Glu/Gln/Arg/opine family amino acid ABC transporter permease subunit